jgi:hypothetical protein
MDSPQPSARPARSKPIRIVTIIAALALVIGAVVGITHASKKAPEQPLVWLDPAQFARQKRPGRLKMLYNKTLNFAAPVLKHFNSPKRQILIDAQIFSAQAATSDELRLGTPLGTNALGASVRILSSTELQDMRYRMRGSKDIHLVNSPRMTLGDGTWASMCVGQSVPQAAAFIGVSLDVKPKIAAHQFQFDMNAIYSQLGEDAISVKTNLSATCRALVPNAGGILIASPASSELNATNYWLILSPTAIDRSGKPINL